MENNKQNINLDLNNKKIVKLITAINATWRPLMATIIVMSVSYFYVIYPIAYAYFKTKGVELEVPKVIVDNLTSILLTGGVLAGLRTGEKVFGVTNKH
jgi:hypothetical protein